MKRRVVVCDDEPMIRLWLVSELRKAGYRPEGVSDCAALLVALEREPADALVLDVRLPDGSGVDLLSPLGRRHPRMPVVILTAYADPETAAAARAAGARCVLEKPVEPERLLQAVGEALSEDGAGQRGSARGEGRPSREEADPRPPAE